MTLYLHLINLETQAKHKSHNWRSKSAKYQSHVPHVQYNAVLNFRCNFFVPKTSYISVIVSKSEQACQFLDVRENAQC